MAGLIGEQMANSVYSLYTNNNYKSITVGGEGEINGTISSAAAGPKPPIVLPKVGGTGQIVLRFRKLHSVTGYFIREINTGQSGVLYGIMDFTTQGDQRKMPESVKRIPAMYKATSGKHKKGAQTLIRFIRIDGKLRAIRAANMEEAGKEMFSEVSA